MEKKLKDYLHLYLGCQLLVIETGDTVSFDEIDTTSLWQVWTKDRKYITTGGNGFTYEEIKPILRPLDTMTEEEMKDFIGWDKINEMYKEVSFEKRKLGIEVNYGIDTGEGIEHQSHTICFYELSATQFLWLLKNHFDIFSLIPSNLALPQSETKNASNIK
jgi:hypothetical protein